MSKYSPRITFYFSTMSHAAQRLPLIVTEIEAYVSDTPFKIRIRNIDLIILTISFSDVDPDAFAAMVQNFYVKFPEYDSWTLSTWPASSPCAVL